jgi:uncharacterized protein
MLPHINTQNQSSEKQEVTEYNKSTENGNDDHIGKTFISEKFSNTIDSFWVIINPGVLINPFDFVSVDNMNNTKTIGMVKELQRIFLISDSKYKDYYLSSPKNSSDKNVDVPGIGVTIARIAVMANISSRYSSEKSNDDTTAMYNIANTQSALSINMPMEEGKIVVFARADEVIESLGIPEMENPIPAGIIEMTNGKRIPIHLDITYIFGPDTAHVNASGISGNMKTSYLLFLLQCVYNMLSEGKIALIIFNTKEKGLLSIDNYDDYKNYDQKDKELLKLLNMESKHFQNVKYFLPRGKNGKPNSAHIPEENYKTYSYELCDVYDRLELLFNSESIYDPHYNISSIINYIYESWSSGNGNNNDKNIANEITNWTDLINFKDYPEEIVTHKSTLLRFQSNIQRFRKPATLFVDKKITSTYLGKEIKQLKKDDIYVIDIAMLSTVEEQAFVVGDVMRTIDDRYSLGCTTTTTPTADHLDNTESRSSDENIDNRDYIKLINNNYFHQQNSKNNQNNNSYNNNKPKYIVILIDEINRFLPHLDFNGNAQKPWTLLRSSVAEEIIKTLIAGKPRRTALFSAQQFKSQVDPILNDNTGLHVIAKLGLSELSSTSYSMIDETTKSTISKLHKGEIILIHPAFRHPIKITIPKPAFKKI